VTPQRIQRKRTRGWRMSKSAVYVGRPSHWGNRFEVGASFIIVNGLPLPTLFHPRREAVRDAAQAVALYRERLVAQPDKVELVRQMLAGWDLACWCPLDQPCHADVLLELANATGEAGR